MVGILRIDHLHIKGFEYEGFKGAFEQLMGKEFYIEMEFEDQGTEVAYEPYPIGCELFNPTDDDPEVSHGSRLRAAPYFNVSPAVKARST